MAKIDLSTRQKVIYILHLNAGKKLSIKEIINIYSTRYNKPICMRTVITAIDENNHINSNVEESVERRGAKKQPVKVFSIIPKTD